MIESRRDRKKQATKAALLEHAMVLFQEQGIQETRVQDITDRADVGKGVFYNYFKSKLFLVAALVEQAVEELRRNYLEQLNGALKVGPRVEHLTELHQRFFRENPKYLMLFHQARGLLQVNTKGAEPLQQVFRRYLSCIGDALPPAGQDHRWSDDDLLDIAATVAGAIAGYRSMRIAADATPQSSTVEFALAHGVPELMRQRRTIDTPQPE